MIDRIESPPRLARILHYVHDSLPEQTGYTIRTRSVASELVRKGYDVAVAARYEHDVNHLRDRGLAALPHEVDHGVRFLRSPGAGRFGATWRLLGRLGKRARFDSYARWLEEEAGAPDIVHSHSPASMGRAGARLSRRFQAPWVHEVRGFWGLSGAARHAANGDFDLSKAVAADVEAAARATRTVAICKGVADVLVSEGVPSGKVHLIPNGVDTKRFRPQARDEDLARRLNVDGRLVFGCATNVRRIEGIQTVLAGWPLVVRRIPEAVFLLVGGGESLETIRSLVRELNLETSVRLVGRIDHRDVGAALSLLDVYVLPRIPEPVCQIVTPLKPLEAMAMGIPVIASDVAALREQVRHGETGLLFTAGDADAAARACIALGEDRLLREGLSERARFWVERERDWSVVTDGYRTLYDGLTRS